MANNFFKIKKGLIVNGSGSTVVDIQGNSGQLFSITDSLTGVLMSVNDISGLPILEVSDNDTVKMGTFGAEGLIVEGSTIILPNTENSTGDFLTIGGNNKIAKRTAAQVLSDIGAQPTLTNPITGTGTAGQVSFFNGTTTQTGDNGLFWDNTNKRLGIGTTTPNSNLQLVGNFNIGNKKGDHIISGAKFYSGGGDNNGVFDGDYSIHIGEDSLIGSTNVDFYTVNTGLGYGNFNSSQNISFSTAIGAGAFRDTKRDETPFAGGPFSSGISIGANSGRDIEFYNSSVLIGGSAGRFLNKIFRTTAIGNATLSQDPGNSVEIFKSTLLGSFNGWKTNNLEHIISIGHETILGNQVRKDSILIGDYVGINREVYDSIFIGHYRKKGQGHNFGSQTETTDVISIGNFVKPKKQKTINFPLDYQMFVGVDEGDAKLEVDGNGRFTDVVEHAEAVTDEQSATLGQVKQQVQTQAEAIQDAKENQVNTVRNVSGAVMPIGTPVRVVGATGENPNVEVANATSDGVPDRANGDKNIVFGITTQSINDNAAGEILYKGTLKGYDTTAFDVGDFLFVAETGTSLVATPPASPAYQICVGLVTKKAVDGEVCINVVEPIHLNDITGVNLNRATLADKQAMIFNGDEFVNSELKTINGESVIGGGDIEIAGGGDFIIRDNDPVFTDNTTLTLVKTYNIPKLSEYKIIQTRVLLIGPPGVSQGVRCRVLIPSVGVYIDRGLSNFRAGVWQRNMTIIDNVDNVIRSVTPNTDNDTGVNVGSIALPFDPNKDDYEIQVSVSAASGEEIRVAGVEITFKK